MNEISSTPGTIIFILMCIGTIIWLITRPDNDKDNNFFN